jgi:hypothetical protein
MAEEVKIGGDGALFAGEDKTINFEILDADSVPVNMSGWTVAFLVRRSDTDTETVLTASASISGSYNATRASNTQRAVVTILDTDTQHLNAGKYRYSLKRTDDGNETVLNYGIYEVERATQN